MPEQIDAVPQRPDNVLSRLFAVLDTLGMVARRMHPRLLPALAAALADPGQSLRSAVQALDRAAGSETLVTSPGQPDWPRLRPACCFALQACDGLRTAVDADNPIREAYRAMRQYSRAQEALADLAETVPAVGRYLLEPDRRDDPALLERLAAPASRDSGVFHFNNGTAERGGFSVYVPPWYQPDRPCPVIMALHGGAGHGRLFLWNWLPEARTRGLIVIAPTAIGGTWSLMEPDIDSRNLLDILTQVRRRWAVDPAHLLLTGMSDGGTFTLISGLEAQCPFTHLAPVAASFHPLLLAMAEPNRLRGLPIYLTHGARDWMFPVGVARTAHQTLGAAGAAIVYREIADLSHAYPRDEQGAILDWLLNPP